MFIVEKGIMGVGLFCMFGVNNVVLWVGELISFYILFVNKVLIVVGINGIVFIFFIIVDVIGGIGFDFKNWVKKIDENGEIVCDVNGDLVFEEVYFVVIGIVLIIDIKVKKFYNGLEEFVDVFVLFIF